MTRPLDRHLDDAELDALVSVSPNRVSDSGYLSEMSPREVQRHVESCEDCSRKVQMHRDVQSEISRLALTRSVLDGLGCPKDADWLKVAAGLVPETKTRELMSHASQCDHCGPLLRTATETLSDEATSEEENALAQLNSTRPDWQRDFAGKLGRGVQNTRVAQKGSPWWKGFFLWPRPVFVVGAFAVVAVAGWLGLIMFRTPSAAQLLAQAYTEHRTLEMRISGAKYAPMRVERRGGGSNLEKSSFLLKAEALIGENLRKDPTDPVWLQAKARADLLDGNYDPAIKSLQEALEKQPDSPQLLTDLGSAYFERAEAANQAIDYGHALESLSMALTKTPDDPVALFNRGLVSERMFLYTQAVDDWEHYLRIESRGEWSDDVRKRLEILKEKLKTHGNQARQVVTDPQAFNARVKDVTRPPLDQLEARADEYLELAMRTWLPSSLENAPSPDGIHDAMQIRAALDFLAQELVRSHSDEWLKDMLASNPSQHLRDGIGVLRDAIILNDSGDYDQGVFEATKAEHLFHNSGSEAGILRARFERVYALDRAAKGDLCLEISGPLVQALRSHRYAWLQIQSLIEDSTCRSITGEMERSSKETNEAILVARASGYGTLYLRALGNAASFASMKGDLSKAWALNRDGLSEYWKGSHPPARAFQFYSELSYDAEGSEQPYSALAAAREAVAAIVPVRNRSVEALARYRLASLAQAAGADQEAGAQFQAASQMFSELPETETTKAYELAGKIMLASIQAKHGDFEHSLQLLKSSRSSLPRIANLTVPLQFYQTLGAIYLQSGQYDESDRALRSAVSIGETGLLTMTTDHDRLGWQSQLAQSYRDLVKIRFLHKQLPEDALEFWEWYRAMPVRSRLSPDLAGRGEGSSVRIDFTRLDAGAEVTYPGLVANALPELTGVTILSYAEMEDGLLVWAFDNRGVHSRWVRVSKNELDRHIERFNRGCSDPSSSVDELHVEGRQLYEWLIAPVADFLDSERELIVEADDQMATLPFEALVEPSGTFVGTRFAITSSPGLGYMLLLRSTVPFSRNLPTLVVGAPELDRRDVDEVLPIPDAADEAERVASNIPNARLLVGRAATMEAVRQSLSGVKIFHFAGHALSGRDHSGLLLARPRGTDEPNTPTLLNASTLTRDSVRSCQLIVLSACSTGKANTGGNSESLVRSLLRSGVPHVVASRWNVDSQVTATLMSSFYAGLFSGQSVARALRQSRVDLTMRPNTAHPYYWAAFTAFGRT